MAERMMVVFGMSSPPTVLDLYGEVLRKGFDEDPGLFVETLEDLFGDAVQGVQVWEGVPKSSQYSDEGQFVRFCDFSVGTWRHPRDAEWVALQARRSPFNSVAEELRSLVE